MKKGLPFLRAKKSTSLDDSRDLLDEYGVEEGPPQCDTNTNARQACNSV
jgi:hypothetical protein